MNNETLKIAVLAGDGIGPETTREAVKVLQALQERHSLRLEIQEAPVGWDAIDKEGSALPPQTLAVCKQAAAILFGAVGLHYRDAEIAKEKRPERAALVRLRTQFELFANLRPVRLHKALRDVSPLRPERQGDGIDIMIVRELTGGLYSSYPKKTHEILEIRTSPNAAEAKAGKVRRAVDTMAVTTTEIERAAHLAFRAAWLRRKKVTSIDKANILETSILWREIVTDVSRHYPDVTLEHMLVDTAAMQLILRPSQFDVLLCENTFGDILGDEAAALAGSIGMLPGASLAPPVQGRSFGLFSQAGGSAPDIAGKNVANPIAQILSAALMLRYSFGLHLLAKAIEEAVDKVITDGLRTADISSPGSKQRPASTAEMGDAIAAACAAK
ncbi:MAG: 3-isopropylmalate dehydrogenase [Verrucomicrobiia bacterium]